MAYVYILASGKDKALYVGCTTNLVKRIEEHKSGKGSAHTAKYWIVRLVWFQEFPDLAQAQEFEGRLKRWRRAWKDALIEELNPTWDDLTWRFNE